MPAAAACHGRIKVANPDLQVAAVVSDTDVLLAAAYASRSSISCVVGCQWGIGSLYLSRGAPQSHQRSD